MFAPRTLLTLLAATILLAGALPASGTIITLQPGPTEGKDTRVFDYTYGTTDNDNTNFGADSLMWVGSNTWRGGYHNRTFLTFDLSSIPATNTVLSAKLDLYLDYMEHRNLSDTVYVRRLTNDWTEGTGGIVPDPGAYDPNVPATWNNQPPADATNWASLTIPVQGPSGHGSVGKWFSWDITALVEAWTDGTYPNDGLMLIATPTGTGGPTYRFASSDHVTTTWRPTLTVEHGVYYEAFNIGDRDGNQDEFEQEGDLRNDAQFYDDAGDYTGVTGITGVGADVASAEPWINNDSTTEGFPRALTSDRPDLDIFFMLSPEQGNLSSRLDFETNLIMLGTGSSHDLEFLLNGTVFDSLTNVTSATLVQSSIDPSLLVPGGNVLSIRRTGGGSASPWIQFDYLTLSGITSTIIPEPSTFLIWSLLAGLGLGLGWRRRRTK